MHRTKRTALLLMPLLLAAALPLTGCSAIRNAVERTHEQSFDDRAAAVQGWAGGGAPEWLPEDATDIRTLTTTDGSNSVIAVTSADPLPEGCTEAERRQMPFDAPDWAPQLDVYPDRVDRCGDYEVLRTETGWFGWFSATEPGQLPTPAL